MSNISDIGIYVKMILELFGGLALFLYGINVMGEGLSSVAGSRIEMLLEKATNSGILGVGLGMLVTAVIQSSSATTVMVVDLVDSGLLKLKGAAYIIMGSNIGTTITSWIILLPDTAVYSVIAVLGVIILYIRTNNTRWQSVGKICIGMALLMYGMNSMSSALLPLAECERFRRLLVAFENPVMGVLAGTIVTAAIQSSSASIGILQALCITGTITYKLAIPVIMGQNIGTCITTIISAIGTKENARRAAMIHLYFNLIGVVVFMLVFYGVNLFLPWSFIENDVKSDDIALIHTLFNIGSVILLYPFAGLIVDVKMLARKNNKKIEKSC